MRGCQLAAALLLAACGKGGGDKAEPLSEFSPLRGVLATLEDPAYSDAIATYAKEHRGRDRGAPPTFTAEATCGGHRIEASYHTGTPSLVVNVNITWPGGRVFPVELKLDDRVSATDYTDWEKLDQLPHDGPQEGKFKVEAGKLPELFPAGQQVELTIDATVAVAHAAGGVFSWDKRHRLRGWKLVLPIPEAAPLAALADEGARLDAEEAYFLEMGLARTIAAGRKEAHHPDEIRTVELYDRRRADLDRRWQAFEQLPLRTLGAKMKVLPPAGCKP